VARDSDLLPTGKARRAAQATLALGPSTARLAGSLVTSIGRSPERAQELLEQRHEEIADHALELLGSLRGGAMKIGQLASFVDVELVPPEFRAVYQERLAKLRDAAPPMSWRKIRRVLEHEWEAPIESLFEDFEQAAAAAASIGQVHRARLPDGRRVAVKVQYPEIADALAADLGTAAGVATVLTPLGKAMMPGLDPKLLLDELRDLVLEEVDYELEAQHQRYFARAYRDHPFIYVPPVVTELSRRRVLVSEWVDGIGFQELVTLPQAERDRIAEILQRFYLGGMNHVGRFNTDPHPGNYLLREDGRMALLDFGSVKVVDPAWLETSRRLLGAVIEGDSRRMMEGLAELGYLHRADVIDPDLLLEQVLEGSDWYLRDQELRIDPDYVARIITKMTDPRLTESSLRMARGFKIPPEEIWFRRVELGVLAVAGQLRARGNWHRIMREYLFADEPSTELGRQEWEFFDAPRAAPPQGQ
jgi:predicted unusual protein kinase regulating ubiquinone biosynthesis (AarF/ABC1/UbiB family)